MLDPRASESAHNPFQSTMSAPYSPMIFLDVSLVGSTSQISWEFVSPVQVPRSWVPDMRQKPLTPQGGFPYLWDASQWLLHLGVGFLARSLLLPISLWPFYPLLWSSCSVLLFFFRRELFSYVAVDLLCLWEEVSSGSPCATILNCWFLHRSLEEDRRFDLLCGAELQVLFVLFCLHGLLIWIPGLAEC